MLMKQEFQAVVLAAGKGSRMQEIAAGRPKCLLPVGNKPLVWYPLNKLEQSGFTEAILVVIESQKGEIQHAIEKTDSKLKIDYFTVPGNEELGTADSLRLLHDKLKSDVIVLSCDLITDVNLRGVLDLNRKHNASICTLFFNPKNTSPITAVPGPKAKHKPERDLVGIDAQTNRLVFLASASDFEENVGLQRALLKKHSNLNMYSSLIDSHLYIMKNWIIKYLQHEENISTIKGELLPHVVKKQLSKPRKENAQNVSVVGPEDKNDIFHFATESDLNRLIRETSAYSDHKGDLKSCYHDDVIRCYAFIADSQSYGARINTLANYWVANGKIIDAWGGITGGAKLQLIDEKADVKSNQVDDKCVVWENCKLHEKTAFKNSIIGANCEVHSFSRIFNSILMNNVIIKEKVALENCIISDGAIIENECQIKNSIIGSHHTVPAKSQHENEILTQTDRLMEF